MLLVTVMFCQVTTVQAGTIYQSPYVTLSPNGKAFTTNAGDKTGTWYTEEDSFSTGIESSLRELIVGEHYYKIDRADKIPVGEWKMSWKPGICCHDSYPDITDPYYGIKFRRKICSSKYYSGWMAYCADCKEQINSIYIYMSKEAARTITELDMDMEYYYLCPTCTNLEQGSPMGTHKCNKISWNRYKIQYNKNTSAAVGYMEDSIHMYNNATEFEGKSITPASQLTMNRYTIIGKEFVEWNTKPDGSGIGFSNGQQVINLTTENLDKDDPSKGVITLYAQWKRSESTLNINPSGGTYEGSTGISSYKNAYGSKYQPDENKLVPPNGYTVAFDTKGGNPVGAIVGKKSFVEWSMSLPLNGKFINYTYFYTGKDGTSDTLTAIYKNENIILPPAQKDNSSFGGWYYDPECTKPAGGPGDSFTPESNVTLYAKWVELVLNAKDNYTADGGKGAVDLSWEQKDDKQKTYLLYQSRDNVNWTKVSSANDISSSIKIEETFRSNGSYTVPYSGMYILSAAGAQGGNYGSNPGGAGGSVSGTVWLNKGEKLTYAIGGQDGTNGGGRGTMFANGGGYTLITSNQKGDLIIAGGGGGATSQGAGGAGGSTSSVITSGRQGQEGGAGGGGGHQGGSAGEYVVHNHTAACWRTEDLGYTLFQQIPFTNNTPIISPEFNSVNRNYGFTGSFYGNGTGNFNATAIASGSASAYANMSNIPVKGNTQVEFHVTMDSWSQFGYSGQDPIRDEWGNIIGYDARYGDETYVRVYTQDGTCIYNESAKSIAGHWSSARQNAGKYGHNIDSYVNSLGGYLGNKSGWFWSDQGNEKSGKCRVIFNEVLNLPPGTTSLRFETNVTVGDSHYGVNWAGIKLKGGTNSYTICGYQEGQVISAKPAYGGSNYIAPGQFINYSDASGKQAGNGLAGLESVNVGYLEELSLQGVKATDLAAPDVIDMASVIKEHKEDTISVTWKEPKDNGTAYYHRAESYLLGSTNRLSESNITLNILVSKVRGYYYLVDQSAGTSVNSSHSFLAKGGERLNIPIQTQEQYIHLAAVDVAGNIGPSIHIPISRKDAEVAWNLATEKPVISSAVGSVYPATGADTYYVKCDGETPFSMTFNSRILGEALETYQINHTIFSSVLQDGGNGSQAYGVYTPAHAITNGSIITNADGLQKEITGDVILTGSDITTTTRSDYCKKLNVLQSFTLGREQHGIKIQISPTAGADHKEGVIYSDHNSDLVNSIYLIGDGQAPEVFGDEILEGMDLVNRNDGEIHLDLRAEDTLSGVKEFYVEIHNTDNANTKKYLPDGTGHIKIDITKDSPIFSGDFQIIIYTKDNVGNEDTLVYGTTEFSLTTSVSRILEPHEPVFKTGESGTLNIITYGYADRVEVEFPAEMVALNPELNKTFHYGEFPLYRQEENMQFMIPLYTPLNENFQIVVRAYKGDKQLEDYPAISIIGVDGTVLSEIRTRLR